jgi:AraC family transcriptional regulator
VLHNKLSINNRPCSTRRRVFMEPWRARCVQGYVAVQLSAKIKLGDPARVAQFSPSKFNRLFKARFGCTPGQYIRRMRIARAQTLMTMYLDPLSQIAAECGFADQSHLTRCFRKVVGESPATWRAQRCKRLQDTHCSTAGAAVREY